MYGYGMDAPAVWGSRVSWSRAHPPEATAPPLPSCPPGSTHLPDAASPRGRPPGISSSKRDQRAHPSISICMSPAGSMGAGRAVRPGGGGWWELRRKARPSPRDHVSPSSLGLTQPSSRVPGKPRRQRLSQRVSDFPKSGRPQATMSARASVG